MPLPSRCVAFFLPALLACGGATNAADPPIDATAPSSPDSAPPTDAAAPRSPDASDPHSPEASAPRSPEASAPPTCASLAAPTNHRPTATACATTRPAISPGQPGVDAGPPPPMTACTVDSQCDDLDAGKNGRCDPAQGFDAAACTYDTCFTDTDCPAQNVCQCDSYYGNACLPGNCRVDSDCACGFCSPSSDALMTCLPSFPGRTIGWFCHTPNDQCTNDAQCGSGAACAWLPTVGYWGCVHVMCGG